MTRSGRAARDTRLGYAMLAVGTVITVAWFALVALVYSTPYSPRHTLPPGPVYLSGAFRDQARTCILTAPGGGETRVGVPAMPKRGLQLAGVVVDAGSGEATSLVCNDGVHATGGLVARTSAVGEQWIVLFLGLLLAVVGMYRLGWILPPAFRYP